MPTEQSTDQTITKPMEPSTIPPIARRARFRGALIDRLITIVQQLSRRESGADHIIIIVVQDGHFTYVPTLLRVKQGDTVEFRSHGSFEVMFKKQSPGDKLFLTDHDPILTIDKEAEYAVYHYAAAIQDGQHVFLDSACGDIAVET